MYELQPGQEKQLLSYLPTSYHDYLLIDLWGKMERDKSLYGAMFIEVQSLLAFCHLLAKPSTRIALDREGPYFCAWTERALSGISLGLWIREDHRKSRQCLIHGHHILEELFQQYPVVVVITRDEMTKRFHEHFGFIFDKGIPHLYEGDTAYISYLTKEDYIQRQLGYNLPLDHRNEDSLNISSLIAQLSGGA